MKKIIKITAFTVSLILGIIFLILFIDAIVHRDQWGLFLLIAVPYLILSEAFFIYPVLTIINLVKKNKKM